MATLACFNCGGSLADVTLPFSRRADCPHCRAELHCCRMCTLFDARIAEQCREDRAEPPTRKDIANFCEWFTPAAGRSGSTRPDEQAAARLDALFEKRDSGNGGNGGHSADAAGAGSGAGTSSEDGAPQEAASAETDPETPLSPEELARRRLDDLFR